MSRPITSPPWKRSYTNIFGLFIGIDTYQFSEFMRLKGAVRDAFAYKNYLSDYLGVPDTQIRMLINQAASRDAILEAFKSFKEDNRINVGDPIFIVFAGHGTQIEAPPGWETGGRHLIQALVPYDYCSTRGLEVPCIPDRTIGALLEDIAETKGNNITIVLDCCHAGSGTRAGVSGLRIRSVTLKPSPIHTQDLDRDIWDTGYKVLHPNPRFRYKGLHSHILLAACSSFERAGEVRGHGKFSRALIKLLKSIPPDELRYSQILSSLDTISEQNPQIEGVEQDRFLFGVAGQARSPSVHPLYFDDASGLHFINLGTAQGVTQGSTFNLMPAMNVMNPMDHEAVPIGSFVVVRAMSFCSMMTPQSDVHEPFAAVPGPLVVRRCSEGQKHPIRLYISPKDKYQASRKYLDSLLRNQTHGLRDFVIVDDPSEAQFEVSINRGKAIFQLLDKAVTQHGFHYRYPRVDAQHDKVASFLKIAQDHYTELYHTSDNNGGSDLMDDIEISCFQLEERPSMFNEVSQMDMVTVGQDLCEYNQIDLVVKVDSCYGFKIINHGSRDLYPTLSWFDCRDLGSITNWYKPSSSGPYQLEAPLKRYGGSLTIGYGNGGAPPVMFSLQEDQDIAVGFLKLSVFTKPVQFINPSHHSLFPDLDSLVSKHTWGSMVIPIIQRRRAKQTPTGSHYYWPQSPDLVDHRVGAHCHAMSRRTASMPTHLLGRSA